MHKRVMAAAFAIVLTLGMSAGLTSCGGPEYSESFTAYDEVVDTEYAKEVIENISSFGDDPATGNRSAGSPAEKQVVDYLKGE